MVVNEKQQRKFGEDILEIVQTFASHFPVFCPLIPLLETALSLPTGKTTIVETYIKSGGQRHDLIQALREYNIEWFLRIARRETAADPDDSNFVTMFWRGFESVTAEQLTAVMPWKMITHMYNQINISLNERCARRVYEFNELYHSFLDNMPVAFPPTTPNVDLHSFYEKHIIFLRPMIAFDLFKDVLTKADPMLMNISLGTMMQFKETDCSEHEMFDTEDFFHLVRRMPFMKQLSLTPEMWQIQFVQNSVNRRYVCNTLCQLVNIQVGIPKSLIPTDLTTQIQAKINEIKQTVPRAALQNADGTPNIAAILAQATRIVRSLQDGGENSALQQLQNNVTSQNIDIDHEHVTRLLGSMSGHMPDDLQLLCTVGMGARDPFQDGVDGQTTTTTTK